MAIKTIITDDLDGTEGAETITFALGAEEFEIDLAEKNAAALRGALAPFIDSARRRPAERFKRARIRASHTQHRRPAAETTINNNAIRDWARQQNMEVSDRGRVPRDVVVAFERAHDKGESASMFSAANS